MGIGLRPAERPALAEADAEVAHQVQIVECLDALGDECRAERLRDLLQRAQRLQLLGVLAQIAGEVLVDLDDLGLELGPQAQARAAVAEVVQRELDLVPAQAADSRRQRIEVTHVLVLGELDDDAFGGDRCAARQRHDRFELALREHSHQRRGAQVEKQSTRPAVDGPGAQRQSHALDLQLDRGPFQARGSEQLVGGPPAAARRRANQRFVAVDGAVGQFDDRLEMRLQHAQRDQFAHVARGRGGAHCGRSR